MSSLQTIAEQLWASRETLGLVGGLSLCLTVLGSVATIRWVLNAPQDLSELLRSNLSQEETSQRPLRIWFRAILGGGLILLGGVMLFIPGPGTLALIAGLVMLPLRAKTKWLVYLLSRPQTLATLNKIRKRYNRSPMVLPKSNEVDQPD